MPPRVCDAVEGATRVIPDATRLEGLWIEITTADREDAATDSGVYLNIHHDEHFLSPAYQREPFARGATNVWSVPIDGLTLGELREAPIFLEHDGRGERPAWFVERIALRLRVPGDERVLPYLEWKPIGWLATDQPPNTTMVWLSRERRHLTVPGARHLVALRDAVYSVAADRLHRVEVHGDLALHLPLGQLPRVTALAAHDGALFAVSAHALWRLDPASGARTPIGPPGAWPRATALAAHAGVLYGLEADSLWRVAPDGAPVRVGGAGDWPDATALASHGGALCILSRGSLWHAALPAGGGTLAGDEGQWAGATHLVGHNGTLFVAAEASLYRVADDDGRRVLAGAPGGWTGVAGMASLRGALLVLAQDGLWRAPADHVPWPLFESRR